MENIPVIIKDKFENTKKTALTLIENAEEIQATKIDGSISFRYQSRTPKGILTNDERAQSICFITRYESLPILEEVNMFEDKGEYYLNNFDYIKHVLNEYRALIQNKNDSIYYQKIHNFCRQKMVNRDINKDLVITVYHTEEGDITNKFIQCLDERCKSIRTIMNNMDFSFLYNGILQHSDHRFTTRYMNEYVSGDLNYTFLKHALVLGALKDWLYLHYRILNSITFLKKGSL